MQSEDSEIVLEIVPSSSQLRKQLQGRHWCFQILFFRFARLSAFCSYRINSSKCLLVVSYLLLFAVVLARCTIYIFLLEENSEIVPTHEGLLVCLDICCSGLWLICFIVIFTKKLRRRGVLIERRRVGAFIFFCVIYYGCFLWSVNKLDNTRWEPWNPFIFSLTIAYGFLAEKSPNCCIIAGAGILIIAVIEVVIRMLTCSFYNPFSESVKYFIEKRVPAVHYDEEKHDSKKCMICLNKFMSNERLCGLECHESHMFHTRCIKQWLRINYVCPCCRAAVI
eukprot:TRINITY_DN12737_c0_g6_i1.p1 TRINITY_DN12737_c0_g6~~TRINITY_DN12737_c0_g6_i1.p1  ORF type:complete len:280 (-),score=21.43 TRINITY_DN12737_c0_g6_i1:107-946(-)